MPSESTTALGNYHRAFWVSQYFQKSCFPTMAYCIFCDMSQFTTPPPLPPHPHPLSGAQIRSIPDRHYCCRERAGHAPQVLPLSLPILRRIAGQFGVIRQCPNHVPTMCEPCANHAQTMYGQVPTLFPSVPSHPFALPSCRPSSSFGHATTSNSMRTRQPHYLRRLRVLGWEGEPGPTSNAPSMARSSPKSGSIDGGDRRCYYCGHNQLCSCQNTPLWCWVVHVGCICSTIKRLVDRNALALCFTWWWRAPSERHGHGSDCM